jgi:hypothetical protein
VTTVNIYPVHDDASAKYRLLMPAQTLIAAGHDVQIIWPETAKANPDAVRGSDVAVLSRPDNVGTLDMIRGLQAVGTRVIVDMDDLLGNVSPNHSMYQLAPTLHHWAKEACAQADMVTASTSQVLIEYHNSQAANGVIHNRVPQRYFAVSKKDDSEPVIGWSGTIASHPTDLMSTGGAVGRFLRFNKEWTFGHIGPTDEAKYVMQQLGIKQSIKSTGWVDFEAYPNWLCQLDIGIVPLRLTRFNDGKSWLKALEMSALGANVVMSPTEENVRLHREYGIGLLARNPSDWDRQLRLLVTSGLGSPVVPFELTIEGGLDHWREAWGL